MKKVWILMAVLALACGVLCTTTIPALAAQPNEQVESTNDTYVVENVDDEPFVVSDEGENVVYFDNGGMIVEENSDMEVIVLEDGSEMRISCSSFSYIPFEE